MAPAARRVSRHTQSRSRRSGSGSAVAPVGLTADEVEQRRGTAAVQTEESRTKAVLEELVESVVEPLQLLLVAVGVLSAIFGELRDAIAIFAIIALVSAVEAISEVRASTRCGRCAASAPRTRSSGGTGP